jgi:hypothetical protein
MNTLHKTGFSIAVLVLNYIHGSNIIGTCHPFLDILTYLPVAVLLRIFKPLHYICHLYLEILTYLPVAVLLRILKTFVAT